MAEIKVERKNKAPIWPWIIGILVLLGIIWFLVEAFEEEEPVYEEAEVEEVGDASLQQPLKYSEAIQLEDFAQA